MTLRVVPGSTVDRTTTSWRVRFRPDRLANFGGDRLDGGEAKRPVSPAGRAHANEGQVGALDRLGHIRRLPSDARSCTVRSTSSSISRSTTGDLPGADQIDLGRCLVDADDRMAAVGETGGTNGSHIAKSEHTDPHNAFLYFEFLVWPWLVAAASRVAAAIRRSTPGSSRRMGFKNFQRRPRSSASLA